MGMPNSRTVTDPVVRFWARTIKGESCWMWTGARSGGSDPQRRYGTLWDGRNRCRVYAHRFSWEIHHGSIPAGLHVLHICDVTLCVNPKHLFIGTPLDNMRDMVAKGRSLVGDKNPSRRFPDRLSRGVKHGATIPQGDEHWTRATPERLARGDDHWANRTPEKRVRGEQNGSSKLTAEQVREIRRLAADGWSQPRIGRRFGVRHSTIGTILRGTRWTHVQ